MPATAPVATGWRGATLRRRRCLVRFLSVLWDVGAMARGPAVVTTGPKTSRPIHGEVM